MNRTLLVGAGVLAALALLSSSAEARGGSMSSTVPFNARLIAVERVARHEGAGKYDAINRNTDGAGVSIGLIQWSQAGGGLIELLRVWRDRARAELAQHLGPSWPKVLEVAAARSKVPVDGAQLWDEPWLSRWRAALRDPKLIALQIETAASGSHMRGAEEAFRVMGLRTVRSLATVYDRAVQQGPGRAISVARRVQAEVPRASEREKIARFVALITPYAGRWAADAKRRADSILADAQLPDLAVEAYA